MQCPNVLAQGNAFWTPARPPHKEGESHPGATAAYGNPSMRHALVSGAGVVASQSGEQQELILPAGRLAALTLLMF